MIQQAVTWFFAKILHKREPLAEQTLLFQYSQSGTTSALYLCQLLQFTLKQNGPH